MSQGPSCTLPLRPYWYRLAISWIPRYVIMISILAMYVAIYIHAETQFGRWKNVRRKNFLHPSPKDSSPKKCGPQSCDTAQQRPEPATRSSRARFSVDQSSSHKGEDPSPNNDRRRNQGSRKSSLLSTLRSYHSRAHLLRSLRESLSEGMGLTRHSSTGVTDAHAHSSNQRPRRPAVRRALSEHELRQKRDSVRRQLRVLFVYPICYFLIFLIPFVSNFMNYSDYRVQHPIFGVSLLSAACIASIGFMDCLIFSLRERPWRHIPGSDGSLFGSFLFWRHDPNGNTPSTGSYCSTALHSSRASQNRGSRCSHSFTPPRSSTASARHRMSASAASCASTGDPELNLSGPMRGPWRQPNWAKSVRESKGESLKQQYVKEELASVQEMSNWDFPAPDDSRLVRRSGDRRRDEVRQSRQSGELRERDWFDRDLSSAIGKGEGQV